MSLLSLQLQHVRPVLPHPAPMYLLSVMLYPWHLHLQVLLVSIWGVFCEFSEVHNIICRGGHVTCENLVREKVEKMGVDSFCNVEGPVCGSLLPKVMADKGGCRGQLQPSTWSYCGASCVSFPLECGSIFPFCRSLQSSRKCTEQNNIYGSGNSCRKQQGTPTLCRDLVRKLLDTSPSC